MPRPITACALPFAMFMGSSACLVIPGAAPPATVYGAVRVLQIVFIAPVFPVAGAGIARHAGGQVIGAVNSARIGAAFVGAGLATTVLAVAPAWALYLVLAALGPGVLPVTRWRRPPRARA